MDLRKEGMIMQSQRENNAPESPGVSEFATQGPNSDLAATSASLSTPISECPAQKPQIDPVARAVAKANAYAFRRSLGLPTMSRAIRLKCLDCSGQAESDIRNCVVSRCELWPFRMGRGPKPADLRVAQFSNRGELIKYEDWPGYMK